MQSEDIFEFRFPVAAIDHGGTELGRQDGRAVFLRQVADPAKITGLLADHPRQVCKEDLPIERLPVEFGATLEKSEKARVVTVDFGANGVGYVGIEQGRIITAPLEDQSSLVFGPLLQNRQDIADVA